MQESLRTQCLPWISIAATFLLSLEVFGDTGNATPKKDNTSAADIRPVDSDNPVTDDQEEAGVWRELVQQREQNDLTIWKDEVHAQAFEQVFLSMWDDLRANGHALEILQAVNLQSIAIPAPGPSRSLEWGIEETRFVDSDTWLDRSQFGQWLGKMKSAGYALRESEWHHSEFEPAQDGRPARSLVSFLLHITGPDSRIQLRGELQVRWTAESTATSPQLDDVKVVNTKCYTRSGAPVFEVLDVPLTETDQARAQPLLVYDLDGDGLSELVLGEANVVYRNLGNGKFHPQNFLRTPMGTLVNGIIADFDRDGRPDYVSVGSDYSLYRYEADDNARFGASGEKVCDIQFDRPQAFSAADVDGDGDLDLWIGQYKPPFVFGQMPTPYYDANDGFNDYLLLNDGSGKFTDGTEAAQLSAKAKRRTYTGSLVDLNGDRHPDLIVVSDFSGVDVYHNDGTGRFTDVTDSMLAERHTFGMGCSLADYDGNGLIDFYVIGMSSTTARRLSKLGLGRAEFEQIQAMRPVMGYGNRMYMNTHTNRYAIPDFNDQIARTGWSWGCSSFDFDNDGDKDIYVANGHRSGKSCQDYCTAFWRHDIYIEAPEYDSDLRKMFSVTLKDLDSGEISWNGFEHNKLYLNRGGTEFVDVAWLLGVAFEYDSRSVVSDDIDSDGRMDLLVTEYQTRGDWETFKLHAYRNVMETQHHWIGVRLHDSPEGGSALGAQIVVTASGRRQVHQIVTGDSFTAQHASVGHFGLGEQGNVESVTVHWSDGRILTLQNPASDRYYDLLTSQSD